MLDEYFVTSNPTIWTALRINGIYPYKVFIVDTTIKLFYEKINTDPLIPLVTSGKIEIDEFSAHGSTVIWKAIYGIMKMLQRRQDALDKTKISTSDQYTVWAFSFRGIDPISVKADGRDAVFEYSESQIDDIKKIIFGGYTASVQNITVMRSAWKLARTLRISTNE